MHPLFKKVLLCLCLALLSATAWPQRYVGIATSNWSAINSLYLNPATIADCGEKISINVLSMNAGIDNDLGGLPKIPDIGSIISDNNNIFTQSQKTKFSMMAPEAVVRGPGIMVSVSKNISLGFTTDIRVINQFNNFDPALYKIFGETGALPSGQYTAKAQNFNWTAHMWSEAGVTLGAVVGDWGHSRLNFGLTIRRLSGIGYVTVIGKNLDINYNPDSGALRLNNSDIQYSSNVGNDSATPFKHITPGGLISKFFGETAGGGFSSDIGFTYRYRIGEPEQSDYMESNLTHDLVLSVAITDFGAIRYYNSDNAILNISGSGNATPQVQTLPNGTGTEKIQNINNAAGVAAYAHQHGFGVDTTTDTRKVYLPVALVASADAQIYGRFFVNMLYIANLADRNQFGNSYYNQVTFTPRYDYHKITLAMPITYSMLAHDVKMGFAFRYSGFFIGSDDVLALISKYQYGFNVYFGGYIPLFKINHDPMHLHWGS